MTTPARARLADVDTGSPQPRLPRWAPVLVAVLALAAAGLPGDAARLGPRRAGGAARWCVFLVALPAWSPVVENRRAAVDRLMTALIWSAFGVALIPLVWLIWTVVSQGASVINGEFLTYSMRNIVGDGGGIYHALIGTLLITLRRRADLGAGRASSRRSTSSSTARAPRSAAGSPSWWT